ncbi:hypothetical protein LTR53_000818 [Teratosphaeriaceae sp. CCFEE 6253]|nr:hypothetical protein LTR53_000818 [Teratosphaeriaceae sp. CCFEE 6253]
MGIPYSKQINAAFDEVTPLVAAAFDVLQTTKNIALFLLAIQIVTIVVLISSLFALLGLLITVNPNLTEERDALVTPVLRWGARRLMNFPRYWRGLLVGFMFILLGCAIGAALAVWLTSTDFQRIADDADSVDGGLDGGKLEGDEK